MKEIKFPIYGFDISPAEKVLSARMPKWRHWLLRKLMPVSAWETPPQFLGRVEKGAVIGSVKLEMVEIGDTTLEIGKVGSANDRRLDGKEGGGV